MLYFCVFLIYFIKCFFLIFLVDLAQLSTTSHEYLLLQLWEEVKNESPGDLATSDHLDHVIQRSHGSELE